MFRMISFFPWTIFHFNNNVPEIPRLPHLHRFPRPAADLEALAQVICQVGQITCQWQEQIAEMEINPLFVLPEGSGVIVRDPLAALR
ncbi:MAG: acetate--CoA ligase family protein [Deltaproteobacteria bacterium]|nr:acetate--CoA ligase family protein [Deltaproteobacteria bacterium]